MVRLARAQLAALAAAAIVAVGLPAWLLQLQPGRPESAAPRVLPPLAPPPQQPAAALFDRSIFAPARPAEEEAPGDAPDLVGIAGRIDRDAVAMVRAADGSTRTLAAGESVDGWRLESLAIDAAFFTRGRERVRVPLPAGEADQ